MLFSSISKHSARIPIVLIVGEFTAAAVSLLLICYWLLAIKGGVEPQSKQLIFSALVFATLVVTSMWVFRLYEGRPEERLLWSMLRLLVSLTISVVIFLFLGDWFYVLDLPASVKLISGVLTFFLIGTARPIFLDSISLRRLKRRRRRYGFSVGYKASDNIDTAGLGGTSLTGQHRNNRRDL